MRWVLSNRMIKVSPLGSDRDLAVMRRKIGSEKRCRALVSIVLEVTSRNGSRGKIDRGFRPLIRWAVYCGRG